MKKLLLAGLMALLPASAEAGEWYISHYDADACVPIHDIGSDGKRAYYGAGSFHTPQEYRRWFTNGGARTEDFPPMKGVDGVYAFMVTWQGRKTVMVFFRDRDACQFVMDKVEK